jgi:hypothetical protein
MRVKTLETTQELQAYIDELANLTSVRLPMEYLQQGMVRGLVARDGKVLGGYALILSGQFRCVRLLPAEQQERMQNLMGVGRVAEATGLFLAPTIRSPFASFWLGLHILADLVLARKTHFIFGYNFDIPGLRRLYSKLQGEVLFRGTPSTPGMKSHATLSLELLSLRNIVSNVPKHLATYLFQGSPRSVSLRKKIAEANA